MILIGQYDSSFVRRVGIALTLYSIPFEHRPWSTFSDVELIRPYNPLARVPTLVLDNGDVLIESHLIIDYIDSLVAPEKAMYPKAEPLRHQALKVAALATGLGDKVVGLFYELRLHEQTSDMWVQRCRAQIDAVLNALEADRTGRKTDYWFGDKIGHADIAVAAVLRHLNDAHPGLVDMGAFPALAAHSKRLEAMPVFQAISQPFIAPS
jgi:glutathione S-transferase